MKLVVGLGNPDKQYELTRHNVGYIALDFLCPISFEINTKFNCLLAKADDTIYIKPTTYMNLSGSSVSKVVQFYKINLSDILVIHDDVDLPFLEVKKQFNKSSAGHNGVQSIINSLGSQEFWRLRIGVGRPENTHIETADWVLSKFTNEQVKQLNENLSKLKALL